MAEVTAVVKLVHIPRRLLDQPLLTLTTVELVLFEGIVKHKQVDVAGIKVIPEYADGDRTLVPHKLPTVKQHSHDPREEEQVVAQTASLEATIETVVPLKFME